MLPKKATEKSHSAIYAQKRRDNTRAVMDHLEATIPEQYWDQNISGGDYNVEGRVMMAAKAYIAALQADASLTTADKTTAGETATGVATTDKISDMKKPFAPIAAPVPPSLAEFPGYKQLFATYTRTMQFIAGVVSQSGGNIPAGLKIVIGNFNDLLVEILDQLVRKEPDLVEEPQSNEKDRGGDVEHGDVEQGEHITAGEE